MKARSTLWRRWRTAMWQPHGRGPHRAVAAGATHRMRAERARGSHRGLAVAPRWHGRSPPRPGTGRCGSGRSPAVSPLLEGHTQNVNGVAFLPNGALASVSHDATIRIWPLGSADATPRVVTFAAPLNALVAAPDGEIAAAGGDGKVYILDANAGRARRVEAAPSPIIALALSPRRQAIAAASIRGAVALIDRASGRVVRTLVGPGLPVWSLAFAAGRQRCCTPAAPTV